MARQDPEETPRKRPGTAAAAAATADPTPPRSAEVLPKDPVSRQDVQRPVIVIFHGDFPNRERRRPFLRKPG